MVHILSRYPGALLACFLLGSGFGVDQVRAQAFSYEFINHSLPGLNYADADWGDLDLDGDLDLVVSGLSRGETPSPLATVYLNQGVIGSVDARGDSVWTQLYNVQGQGVTPVWMSTASWIDVDNDGVLEFVLAGATSIERPFNPVTTVYNLVGSRFETIESGLPGVYGGSFDWGDYDNDGDADLLMTGETNSGRITRIFQNQSDGSFLDVESGLPDISIGDAKFGDFDGDGDLDVVLSGDTGTGFLTALYRNDGRSFSEVPFAFPPLAFSAVDWGDYDNDGDPDILLAGGTLSPLILDGKAFVFRNDGGGTFTDIGADLDGMFYGAVEWGDYDNDGMLDIMLSGANDLQELRLGRLYRNEGGDVFRLSINLAGLLFSAAALGDYDRDGDIDILQVGEGVTNQYRNDQLRVNDPPLAPTGLQTTSAGGSVTLTWSPTFDEQTPAAGLTYNIRVGTAPGAIDVVNPQADVNTGLRLIARKGNVRQNTSWTLTDLAAGNYFWSVQGIDNAFNGSAFSEEGTFIVTSTGGVATDLESDGQIENFRLFASYPNPFGHEMAVEFSLAEPRDVVLAVYNALGERVRILRRGLTPAGVHRIGWDGTGSNGGTVGAGSYLVRLTDGTRHRTLKVVKVF